MPLYGQSGYGYGRYGMADGGPTYALPLSYYQQLITSQYQIAPNFMAWLMAALARFDDATNCMLSFSGAFSLDFAVGAQLDVLGAIVGQSRVVDFQPSNNVSPVLDDATYRIVLQARIARNQWDGKIGSLQGIWASLFPGGRVVIDDGQNMSAIIILSGVFSTIILDLIEHDYIIPRPETVQYTYTFSTLPIFGVDLNDEFVAGVDVGHLI